MGEAHVALDNRHVASKAAHCLGKFKPDETTSNNYQMRWNTIQFKGLNVRERICFRQTRDVFNSGPAACVDEDMLPANHALAAIGQGNFDRFGANEASGPHH